MTFLPRHAKIAVGNSGVKERNGLELSMSQRLRKIFGDPTQRLAIEQRAQVIRNVLNIAIPIIIVFSILNHFFHHDILMFVELGSLLLIVPAWFMAGRAKLVGTSEFLSLFATAMVLLYIIYDGGIAGLGFIWGWLFPFIAFYIVGIRQGWYWCIGFFAVASAIFILNLGVTASYGKNTQAVFISAYVFYLVVSYQFNAIRFQYLFDLETEVHKRTIQIKYASLHDPLTSLPNRLYLTNHIQALIDQQEKDFAVLNLDIDRFNEVNNVLGYDNGDQLLKAFAERIRSHVDGNGFVAHLGADVFTIVLEDFPAGESKPDISAIVTEYTKRLKEVMEQPYHIDDSTIELEITIGIEFPSGHNTNASHMIRRADFACHMAKKEQNNIAIYDPEQDADNARQFQIFGGLKRAIQNRELRLFYQPKIDMHSRKVTDVEALIRWISPENGMIPPDQFIPVGESTGLIYPLTEYVMDTAMQQQTLWHKKGYRINIAINLSARNLMDAELIPFITDCLNKHCVSPDDFTLEVTESAIMKRPDKALQTIRDLKAMGFTLSLDDYGTGYTSLSYLKDMPVDELKIDQCFIFNCLKSDKDKAIVQSTIGLANNLDLKVVAEGIESKAVWDMLNEMGCDKGQGYFMARPMPPEDFPQWLENSGWDYS